MAHSIVGSGADRSGSFSSFFKMSNDDFYNNSTVRDLPSMPSTNDGCHIFSLGGLGFKSIQSGDKTKSDNYNISNAIDSRNSFSGNLCQCEKLGISLYHRYRHLN